MVHWLLAVWVFDQVQLGVLEWRRRGIRIPLNAAAMDEPELPYRPRFVSMKVPVSAGPLLGPPSLHHHVVIVSL